MHSINNLFGAISLEFDHAGEKGLVTIHPEMTPAEEGIKPSERYYIYCVHPRKGSCTFTLEKDRHSIWLHNNYPPFITISFLEWLCKEIDNNNQPGLR